MILAPVAASPEMWHDIKNVQGTLWAALFLERHDNATDDGRALARVLAADAAAELRGLWAVAT